MEYQIEFRKDNSLWDNMLRDCSSSTAFHTRFWGGLIQKHFPTLNPLWLFISQGKQTVGVMPCYLFRPFPFISMLHSLHWNLPGGPLIWDNQKIESSSLTSFLVSTLKSLSRENNLIEIQLNTSPFGPELDETCLFRSGFQVKQENFTHLLNIQQGYDAVWRAFNKRVRGAVRKANKNEVILSISNSEKDMQSFYRIYLSLMKNFNSPPKPYSLMKALQKSSIGSLVVAKHNNIVIGGILILHYNKTLTLWAMASRAQSRHLRPNNALIDFTIRWACDKKYSWVDFGASPPDRVGLVKFKENWRAEKRKFFFYQWVRSSGRYRLWSCAEPPLRSIYGRLQGLRYRRQLQE